MTINANIALAEVSRSNRKITLIMKQLGQLISLTLALIIFAQSVSAQQYYRFKNDKGEIIVIDHLTTDAIAKGYDVLNQSGQLIDRVAPAKTFEELQQEKEHQKKLLIKEREKQRQLKRDAELLRLFASVSDMVRAKEAQLAGITQRSEMNANEKALLIANLEQAQKQAADYERLGDTVPPQLTGRISQMQKQIEKREKNQTVLLNEKKLISDRFDKDIIRFKELQAKRLAYHLDNDKKSSSNTVARHTCNSSEECLKVWQLAQIYASNNATGKIEIITDTLILTASPKQDEDISLSFSKIPGKTNAQVIMEINCNNSEAGTALCKNNKITQIRDGFLEYIARQL